MINLKQFNNGQLQCIIDVYVRQYEKGPFKGVICTEFITLLNEKLKRYEC